MPIAGMVIDSGALCCGARKMRRTGFGKRSSRRGGRIGAAGPTGAPEPACRLGAPGDHAAGQDGSLTEPGPGRPFDGTPVPAAGGAVRRRAARRPHRLPLAAALAGILLFGGMQPAPADEGLYRFLGPGIDSGAVTGPKECAECHKRSAQAWERSLHHTLIKKSHRTKEGRSFAKKLGVKRIKDPEGLCASCHYTVQQTGQRPKVIAGISCETCHNASRDWLKVHSEFSGKKEGQETPEEVQARWAQSEAAGMIRPHHLYRLAANCLACHSTGHEELINVGGHPVGEKFELLSWAMGEVRHNVWETKTNDEAPPERRRMLYLAGLSLTLATSLEALAKVQEPDGRYAQYLRTRADTAAAGLQEASTRLPEVPELTAMIAAVPSMDAPADDLRAAAAAIDLQARQLLERDGSGLQALDPVLPGPDAYVGEVAHP